jgi:type IV pilus assembly protein PilN
MIRINLLAAERPTQKKKAVAGPPGALQAYVIVGGLLGLGLLACAAAWWLQSSALATLDRQIADATKRQQALQVIKVKVEGFERKKALLEAKVTLIERLKAQQSGPVHMLDEISRAVPEFVWLTAIEETGGNVKLTGETNGLTSVADFISNLQRSGWFPRVDLVDSAETNRVVRFTLSAEFRPQSQAGAGLAAGPAAAAAAPARGALVR